MRDREKNPNWKGGIPEWKCQYCGNYFKKYGMGRIPKFCNKECWRKATLKCNKKQKCKKCGKEFIANTNYKREIQKFCSLECAYGNRESDRHTGTFEKCSVCGKEFYVIPSDTDRKYCSMECKAKATGEQIRKLWKNPEYREKWINKIKKYNLDKLKAKDFQGGMHSWTYRKIVFSNIPKKECWLCKSSKQLDIHHIDKNRANNKLSNLAILCRSCHSRLHKSKDDEQKQTNRKIEEISRAIWG